MPKKLKERVRNFFNEAAYQLCDGLQSATGCWVL